LPDWRNAIPNAFGQIVSAKPRSSSRWRLRARKISGEASMTAASATRELAIEIVEIDAERILAEAREREREIGAIETGSCRRMSDKWSAVQRLSLKHAS
jgi:hypothetical protein